MSRPGSPRVFVGVDPGAQGGAAVVLEDGTLFDTVSFGGVTLPGLWAWLSHYADPERCTGVATLEEVGGYVGDEATARGSRMFAFGASYGRLEGLLTASGLPYTLVRPRTWQRMLGCPPRPQGVRNDQWKGLLAEYARSLFPKDRFPKAVADAVLIAEFTRRRCV